MFVRDGIKGGEICNNSGGCYRKDLPVKLTYPLITIKTPEKSTELFRTMERISLNGGALIIVIGLLFGIIFAEPHSEEKNNDLSQQDVQMYSKRKPGALWFGPRLGRKKRNPLGLAEENFRAPPLEREQLDAILEVIQDSPWAIVAVNEGKRHTVNFTPRLGRESGEEIFGGSPQTFGGERYAQESEITGELMSQRSPPFAPRLGRRTFPYSPRLGRENDKLSP